MQIDNRPKITAISLKPYSVLPNNFTGGLAIKKYKGWAVSKDISCRDLNPNEEIK
jgi:hypothetical protein